MKKKEDKNIIRFIDEVYCQEFMVIFAPTHKKFCEIVKRELKITLEPEEDSGTSGMFHGLSNKHCSLALIWSSDKGHNLIHELLHAVSFVLGARDIHIESASSEEAWAYYLSYLYRRIKERITFND